MSCTKGPSHRAIKTLVSHWLKNDFVDHLFLPVPWKKEAGLTENVLNKIATAHPEMAISGFVLSATSCQLSVKAMKKTYS
jgi:hypothetical protein